MASTTDPAEGACPVHGEPMKVRSIKVVYGRAVGLKTSQAYVEARAETFPHSDDWIHGAVTLRRKRTRRVPICAECVAERDRYLARHHPEWLVDHAPESR